MCGRDVRASRGGREDERTVRSWARTRQAIS